MTTSSARRLREPFRANADMSTFQHLAVDARSFAAAGNYVGLTAGPLASLGILENKPIESGGAAEVTIFGITRAKIGGGAVVAGVNLSAANSGWLIEAASGSYVLAMANTNTASGFMAEVILTHAGYLTTSVAID